MIGVAEIQINRKNLISNIEEIRKNLSSKQKIAGVVKANAYGHGLKEVVSVCEKFVDYFQVDDFSELVEIRKITKKPVLVFGYVDPKQVDDFIKLNAILGVYDLEVIKKLNSSAKRHRKTATVHVKVDALLGRQGILSDESEKFFKEISKLKNIKVEAVYSHFSNIEDVDDLSYAKKQHDNLMQVKDIAKKTGFENIFHHISATSGFLSDQKNNWGGQIVRFGIGLYGLWPSAGLCKKYEDKIKLKPVMRWVSKLVQIKQVPVNFSIGYGCTFVTRRASVIGVVPQGYSDGFDRGFSNNGFVLVCGKRCPIIGRVAMNMFVVDLTDIVFDNNRKVGNVVGSIDSIGQISVGDDVVLLGKQGHEEISAEEMADRIGTINYEIVTRVWPRIPRRIV